jgi:hypothetical protein
MPARKRKLQDDDEPLVPHGLVGQALDSAEENSFEPGLAEDSNASPLAPEKGEDRDPRLPKPPRSTASSPHKPSSGRLLHWPEVKRQLGEGRAQIAAAFPGFRAFLKQILDHLSRVRAQLQHSRSLSQLRDTAGSRMRQVRDELRSVREHAIPELQKVRDSAQVPAKVARLRQGISQAATNSRQTWQVWRTSAAPRVQTLRQSLSMGAKRSIEACGAWRAKAAPHIQSFGQSLSAGARKSMQVSRVWRTNTAEQVRAWRERRRLTQDISWTEPAEKTPQNGFRLRIRFDGLPLKMRIAFAQAKLQWQLSHESVARNSRLWSSVALGALAALLVMGLFSMARHFAQASLPSNRVSANSSRESTESATSASILPQALSPAKKPAKKAAHTMNPERSAPKTVAKPQVRHSADSDYVAKDTYVYYGSRASK